MSPECQYVMVIGVSAALLLLLAFYIVCGLKDYLMYRFRNVLIAAICPFLLILIVFMLFKCSYIDSFSVSALLRDFPAEFANLSIAFIGVMGIAMAVSNIALIRHEGRSVKNAIGTALMLVWVIATILVYALVCIVKAYSTNLTGEGRIVCSFIPYFLYCLIDYGECMMIGMMIMGWVAAKGKSAYDKDFIIIPGCSISRDGGLLPLLRGRVNRAVRYAWEQEIATGKPVLFIPSGGQGPDEVMSEASAMELYLLSHSAEDYEVIPEKKSRNTEENFAFSARIVKERNPEARVAFATTNYHVLRCGMLAKRAGLTAEGLASSTKWYFWPNGFAREVVAITNMTRRYHIAAVIFLFAVSLAVSCFVR